MLLSWLRFCSSWPCGATFPNAQLSWANWQDRDGLHTTQDTTTAAVQPSLSMLYIRSIWAPAGREAVPAEWDSWRRGDRDTRLASESGNQTSESPAGTPERVSPRSKLETMTEVMDGPGRSHSGPSAQGPDCQNTSTLTPWYTVPHPTCGTEQELLHLEGWDVLYKIFFCYISHILLHNRNLFVYQIIINDIANLMLCSIYNICYITITVLIYIYI